MVRANWDGVCRLPKDRRVVDNTTIVCSPAIKQKIENAFRSRFPKETLCLQVAGTVVIVGIKVKDVFEQVEVVGPSGLEKT